MLRLHWRDARAMVTDNSEQAACPYESNSQGELVAAAARQKKTKTAILFMLQNPGSFKDSLRNKHATNSGESP